MEWAVFRQSKRGKPHEYVGNVEAPNSNLALQYAHVTHARRSDPSSVWVVPQAAIHELTDEEVDFGGSTDKSYRFATDYLEP